MNKLVTDQTWMDIVIAVMVGTMLWIGARAARKRSKRLPSRSAEKLSDNSEAAIAVISVFGMANFSIYMAISVSLGGDALNGHTAAGHYFLASHGRFTEVTRGVYLYSICHTLLTIAWFAFAAWALSRHIRHSSQVKQGRGP